MSTNMKNFTASYFACISSTHYKILIKGNPLLLEQMQVIMLKFQFIFLLFLSLVCDGLPFLFCVPVCLVSSGMSLGWPSEQLATPERWEWPSLEKGLLAQTALFFFH